MSFLKSFVREGALFPLEKYQASIVRWETKSLSNAEQEATLDRPLCFGYEAAMSGSEDMLAVQPWDAH